MTFDERSRKRISRAVQSVERANPNNQPKRKHWPSPRGEGLAPPRILTIHSDTVAVAMDISSTGDNPLLTTYDPGRNIGDAGPLDDSQPIYLSSPTRLEKQDNLEFIIRVDVNIKAIHDLDLPLQNASQIVWARRGGAIVQQGQQAVWFPGDHDETVEYRSSVSFSYYWHAVGGVDSLQFHASASGDATGFEAFGTVTITPTN